MWEFHAAGGAPKFAWTWACYGGKPFSHRKSATAFLSYQDVIADATRHGFNIVMDRWRIITPSDGIPLYEAGPARPFRKPVAPVPAAKVAKGMPSLPIERPERPRIFEKQL
jgi:hypothetical protein